MFARPVSSPLASSKLAVALGEKTSFRREKLCVSTAMLKVLRVCWICVIEMLWEKLRGSAVDRDDKRRKMEQAETGLCIVLSRGRRWMAL